MKVLVLGAGVVGTSAAYYLARAGHEVTVLDRQPGPALETSFANGGQISASHATPWATPETPLKALKWLGHDDAPLVFRWFRWDPQLWSWGVRFLLNCAPERSRLNTEKTVRIALYSRDVLHSLLDEEDLRYHRLDKGILHVFRDPKAYAAQCAFAEVMRQAGLPMEPLEKSAITALEPALAPVEHELVGAIFSPGDESGDAHVFTEELAKAAAALGVVFRYGVSIQGLTRNQDKIETVVTDQGPVAADVIVLSCGSWSRPLARQVGFDLPIYPAKGYSITLPLQGNPPGAPKVSITDDEHKMVYSRFDGRLRAAGTAELAGWDDALKPKRAAVILRNARALFPEAGDYSLAESWCGLRPKTPDSVPYVCKTPIKNLFLDTGHGTLGWTMAVGSGRIIADLVSGKTPEIDVTGYGLER